MNQNWLLTSFGKCYSSHLKAACLVFILSLSQNVLNAQQRLFFETFEAKTLDSNWQIINGNWHIESVQDIRIAPAENGNEFVLASGGPGLIRLIVDIPDTVNAK